MTTYWNATESALDVFESATHPKLIENASLIMDGLGGVTSQVDAERYLLLTQESERISRAATLIAGAQLLSNGYSARSIVRLLGSSGSASNWANDRLYAQLAPLADEMTAAREASQARIPVVKIDVPLNRTELRTYTFRNVSTSL